MKYITNQLQSLENRHANFHRRCLVWPCDWIGLAWAGFWVWVCYRNWDWDWAELAWVRFVWGTERNTGIYKYLII